MDMIDVYGDESCTSGHRYLVLGALAIERPLVAGVVDRLKAVRDRHNTHGEVKWSKISRAKLDFYKEYVDVFFDTSAQDDLDFRALYVDTHTFNHHRFNSGDAEIGFNKLIYQLLLHKFGRTYGANYGLDVRLDSRTTKADPDELRPMLNSDLCRWGITNRPFRRIRFAHSHECELIQLNDLLVGTVGFKKNLHEHRPGCSAHKIEMCQHIIRRALQNEKPHRLNSSHAKRFAVWPFQFRQKR